MIIKLEVRPNEAYSAKDLETRLMTVGELREVLEGYEDDAQIVTFDWSNYRGANYGYIAYLEELEEVEEDEEDGDPEETL